MQCHWTKDNFNPSLYGLSAGRRNVCQRNVALLTSNTLKCTPVCRQPVRLAVRTIQQSHYKWEREQNLTYGLSCRGIHSPAYLPKQLAQERFSSDFARRSQRQQWEAHQPDNHDFYLSSVKPISRHRGWNFSPVLYLFAHSFMIKVSKD